MNIKKNIILGLGLMLSGFSFAGPKIILKLDDLFVKEGICACVPTFDYLAQNQIKAGFGAIANRSDSTILTTLAPYLNATNAKGEKLFEIWHHGFDHVRPEFSGTGYEYQKAHFEEADKLLKKLLGIQLHSFGTPFNGCDSVTNQVVSENPNYRVFMFSSVKPTVPNGIMYLDNRVNMENGTGNPEFDLFLENYNKYKGNYIDYMVLQGHPNLWTPERLDQFRKIIDFLISEGCEFVLPFEYYQSKTAITVNATNKKANKPNVVVILSDDMGYSDIGCFGSEIKTPNIDRLAANGLRFTQFYNTARCSPTRASLMTGLYPHQAGMGSLANNNFPEEGYKDDLSKNAVTIAEVFKSAGYSTYMTGKWHICKDIAPDCDKSNWPPQRGFDRYFGTLNGSGSYYDPGTLVSNNHFIAPGKNFYYTDAISDTTVKFINEHPADKPFFIYVAYTAAHWPLHAPEKEVAKYKGVYDAGWDAMREQRFKKLKELEIIDECCVLTERGVDIPAWKDEPMKEWQVRRMEVYAAMIDVMDQGIGRIIAALEKKGILDNTVIFFMQDNGGCAEPQGTNKPEIPLTSGQKILKPLSYDSIFYGKVPEYARDGRFVRSGRGVMAGDADTWVAYGEEWANVSNTPYRLYKHWTHQGGIASPLIVCWPKGISAKGELRRQPSHLIDIMATCIEIAGVAYPKEYKGNEIQPYEGKSLVPAFSDNVIKRDFIFWEHEGNRAIRVGNWKLVSRTEKNKVFTAEDEKAWELYDLETDPSETKNLALNYPGKVKEMSQKWEKEALRTKAKPRPWDKQPK